MPAVDNWINKPLDSIQHIYEKYGAESDKHIKEYFEAKLEDGSAISMIPSLNDTPTHNLHGNCLVRFRGMVQDMFDPEFYLGVYEVKDKHGEGGHLRCGKFQDITHCPDDCELNLDSAKNVTRDRQTLYCVPIPGEGEWVKHMYKEAAGSARLDSSVPPRAVLKRNIDGCHDDAGVACDASNLATEDDLKKLRNERHTSSTTGKVTAPDGDLNYPLPGEKGFPCLVKVYDDLDKLKVNDVVEFIGVFSAEPGLVMFDDDDMVTDGYIDPVATAFPEEARAKSPPSSLVPRLHAILARPFRHNNPLLPRNPDFSCLKSDAACTKQKLLEILKHALFADQLAAEYFLCNLLSSVYSRTDVMPLGKFCINLINAPRSPQYSRLLHHLVANITTQSHVMAMSLESMNKAPFSPYKDYTTNRLRSGPLQLADGTHIILDETALQPGQLDAKGLKNITALGTLIQWQKVEYDFNYHRQDFPGNVSMVILSEGTSLLPADYRVPLSPQCDPTDLLRYFADIDDQLKPDTLADIRRYVTVMRNLEFTMDDTLQKAIQDDFVDARKHGADSMTVDDFHSLLNLVRLLSISEGCGTGNLELWSKAKQMEVERKGRVLLLPRPGQ